MANIIRGRKAYSQHIGTRAGAQLLPVYGSLRHINCKTVTVRGYMYCVIIFTDKRLQAIWETFRFAAKWPVFIWLHVRGALGIGINGVKRIPVEGVILVNQFFLVQVLEPFWQFTDIIRRRYPVAGRVIKPVSSIG